MRAHEAAALAAIDAAFAVDILYTGAALEAAPLSAIKSDVPASDFQGPGNTLREISFEINDVDLPERPRKGNVIVEVETSQSWKVNDITLLAEFGKWRLIVEAAS
jgi:hypothetical protein